MVEKNAGRNGRLAKARKGKAESSSEAGEGERPMADGDSGYEAADVRASNGAGANGAASFTIHWNSVSPWRITNCSSTTPGSGKNEATGHRR